MNLDYETYSEADLREVGLANYARHQSTRIILAAWVTDDGVEKQFDERDPSSSNSLDELRRDLCRAGVIHAWNAAFEREITRHVLKVGVHDDVWSCTMGHAQYRSLPGSLNDACEALGFGGKVHDSARLIRLFSMPRQKYLQEQPGDWQRFRQYNRDDVLLEASVSAYLNEIGLPWPEHERRLYLISERINLRGAPVDVGLAELGARVFTALSREALDRIREITGVDNPNSSAQVRAWLSRRLGRVVESIDAAAVKALLSEDLPDEVREVLLLRSGVSLTAPAKYTVAANQACEGRLRHMLQYSGAGRTHRWSGRGFQPQNLRRGLADEGDIETAWSLLAHEDPELLRLLYQAPFKLVADLVRSVIRPPEGRRLVVADFSSIEVVMLHWAAGDAEQLGRLAQGRDPYKDFAARQFGVGYEEVTKEQRTFAKPPVLGGGYGLSSGTLVEYAAGMGVKMTPEQARSAIQTYRDSHPSVLALWSGLEAAMKACIRNGKSYRYLHFTFSKRGDNVICILPSGAEIAYMRARIEETRRCRKPSPDIRPGTPEAREWEADPDNYYWSEQIVYDGVNQHTGKWGPVYTWGGKLTENVVQSLSRDVLASALEACEGRLDLVLHVHDEIIVESASPDEAQRDLQTLLAAMGPPAWCKDAPVRAAGFVTGVYRKD